MGSRTLFQAGIFSPARLSMSPKVIVFPALAEPNMIQRHAETCAVCLPEIVLSMRLALVRGAVPPLYCFVVVRWAAGGAGGVNKAKNGLSNSISLFSCVEIHAAKHGFSKCA